MKKIKFTFIFLIFILIIGITIPSYGDNDKIDIMGIKDLKDLLFQNQNELDFTFIRKVALQEMSKKEINHITSILTNYGREPEWNLKEVYGINHFLKYFYSEAEKGALWVFKTNNEEDFERAGYYDILYNSRKETSLSYKLRVRAQRLIDDETATDNPRTDHPSGCDSWKDAMEKVIEERRQEEVSGGSAQPPSSSAAGQSGANGNDRTDEAQQRDTIIYGQPKRETEDTILVGKEIDNVINDADQFIESGHTNYEEKNLQTLSQTLYKILLSIGIAIAVIIGGILGLKLITETSVEEKAETTKLLIPYAIGCAVVFGGFAIWKIAVTLLQGTF